MVRSGMTLLDALQLIRAQARTPSARYILERIIAHVENGQFLFQGLSEFRKIFGDLYINIVKIGEESGTLTENLLYLAAELKKKQLLRQRIRSAMIYPIIILVATLGVAGILIFMVMPRLLPIFTSLRVDLPWTTRALIAASTFLFANWFWLLAAAAAAIGFAAMLLRIPIVRFGEQRLVLMMPFIGALSRRAAAAEFTRTLGLLLKSGIKIVEALTLTAESMRNLVYRRALLEAAGFVQRGTSLQEYFETKEALFDSTLTRIIEVGSATGTLVDNLFYLAEFYESEVDEVTKTLTSIFEPLLLLVMGLLVGFVAISIITPIYEITRSLRR